MKHLLFATSDTVAVKQYAVLPSTRGNLAACKHSHLQAPAARATALGWGAAKKALWNGPK